MSKFGEKCYCGHAMRSHNSSMGLIRAGIRHHSSCRYCNCRVYIPLSSKKSEWEEINRIKSAPMNKGEDE